MKFLICGDWHLSDKRPENRVDDYRLTVFQKLGFIVNTANDERCDCILQPGDFTDSPSLSYDMFHDIVYLLGVDAVRILTTYGQHDLRFRTKTNTALKSIALTTNTVIVDHDRIHPCEEGYKKGSVIVQGCGYDEEIPEPAKDRYNVLIIHKMIVEDKLWAQQDNFEWSTSFLRRNKFDLIVSGDNHQFFHANNGDRYLFNCGSLLRSSISQVDHKPRVIIFDTEKPHKFKVINVPIEPASKVFAMDKVMKEKEKDEKLAAFVDGLSKQKDMGLSFVDNLNKYLSGNDVDKDVKKIIKDCM